MDHIIFLRTGWPINCMKVCLESLRRHHQECKIHLHYDNYFTKFKLKRFNINFEKINKKICQNRPVFYKTLMAKDLCLSLPEGDRILIVDFDILFQNNPFLMFEEFPDNDLYYSYCLMSTKDSLRPEKIWKSVRTKINGGVWGLVVNDKTKELMNFWIDNLINPSWDKWVNNELRLSHDKKGLKGSKWFFSDQDFLNCIDWHEPPLSKPIKKVDVGYKYNYFTSTWGYFNEELSMRNKFGNKDYKIIHFKGSFQDTFNLSNPRIYNYKNILANKDLTTIWSRDRIYRRFVKRGSKRFELV